MISLPRAIVQQALEALEKSRVFVTTREKIKHPEGTEWYDERITALKTALAQQDQEPELRRLHAVNAELLEALRWIEHRCPAQLLLKDIHRIHMEAAHDAGACARAAIAKATEEPK